MAMTEASWHGHVDLTYQPPLTFTMGSTSTDGNSSHRNNPLGCDWNEGADAFPDTEEPVATSVHPMKDTWGADPSLCVTPEKPPVGSRLLASAKSVRFNPLVEVRRRSDEKSQSADVHMAPDASASSSLDRHYNTTGTSPDIGQEPISTMTTDFVETVEDLGTRPFKPADIGREEETSHDAKSRSREISSRSDGSVSLGIEFEESDALLSKPGFNSSRWLTSELRQLQMNDIDVDLALRKKLATSSRLRTEITEKSCSMVNAEGRRQFVNLVSVDVCQEDLARTVEQMTAARVKSTHPMRHPKTQECDGREPDILDMLTGVGQQEAPSVSLDALPSLHSQLRTVHVSCAFDVIKHIRAWESW